MLQDEAKQAVKDQDGGDYTLKTALNLYSLEQYNVLWEPERDDKCILAWSQDNLIMCAFKGTDSLANVWTDLQVPHPHSLFATSQYAVLTGIRRRHGDQALQAVGALASAPGPLRTSNAACRVHPLCACLACRPVVAAATAAFLRACEPQHFACSPQPHACQMLLGPASALAHAPLDLVSFHCTASS